MKKSKFLQNPKDMFQKSFSPAKCKTSLKLAGSRLKLLRNKKEEQIKQLKKEIAQLLESAQDRTARMRIEHVVREEKMIAAYGLIEIYCELIVARLPIIESQKNCPIDLKEAIASIIFASPRCGDIPEFLDAKKHLTTKYGKDFTTAAIELRPQCGVSSLLVEKLSTAAPDGPTKVKILSAIAEEYNIQWEHKSFDDEISTSNDLLSGPSKFDNQSKPSRNYEIPAIQTPSTSPIDVHQQDPRTSSVQTSGIDSSFQLNTRPLGNEKKQVFHGDGNWQRRSSMEFKDATEAAHEAAECAERASMAARAAVLLSTHERITRHYSTESHELDAYDISKDDRFDRLASAKISCGGLLEETSNRSSTEDRNLQHEQRNGMKRDTQEAAGRFKKDGSQSASLRSNASDSCYNSHDPPVADAYYLKKSFKEVTKGETCIDKDSFNYKDDGENDWMEKSREERIGKQPSHKSHCSASSISVTFDASDGSSPESDEDTNEHRRKDHSGFERKQYSNFSKDELKSDYWHKERNQRRSFDSVSAEKFSSDKFSAVRLDDSRLEPDDPRDESDSVNYEGLNFGKLTGGFRHKGYNLPAFLKNQSDAPSSHNITAVAESAGRDAFGSPKIIRVSDQKKSTKASYHYSESYSDSSEYETSEKVLDQRQEASTPGTRKTVEVKSSSRTSSYSKTRFEPVSLDEDLDPTGTDWKCVSGTPKESQSQRRNSNKHGNTSSGNLSSRPGKSSLRGGSAPDDDQPHSSKATYNTRPESISLHWFDDSDGDTPTKPINSVPSETQQEFESSRRNSSRLERPDQRRKSSSWNPQEKSNSGKSTFVSSSLESPKQVTLNTTTTNKKASHVHPKLPDYDTLVQSLRLGHT